MPRLLVLALENWLGAARLPKALTAAGFEVSLICCSDTLISLTKYANDRDICALTDSAEVVVQRMWALLDRKPACLIIPADDRALRFLQHIVEVAPMGMLPPALIELVAKSLPEKSAFKYGSNKDAASSLMRDLGFRTPARTRIWSLSDLREFVSEVGLPVVIKPLEGTAGEGVQILRTTGDVDASLIAPGAEWMAQQYIAGKSVGVASVAIEGRCLGTIIFEKTVTYPGETGPASVATRLDNEEMLQGSRAFAKATRFNGFFSPGYMMEAETDLPYFLEVNSRPVPIVPSSAKLGLDLCAALYARLVGAPIPKQDDSAPRIMALYPQELHRDPNSPYREHILDEPIDDPLVHQAMQNGIEMIAAGVV